MGEIADMMIDGVLDFYTGEYIGRGVGYPRTVDKSLPWERDGTNHAYRGIAHFLFGLSKQDIKFVIKEYAKHNGVEVTENFSCKKYAIEIQKDWPAFKKWIKSKKA